MLNVGYFDGVAGSVEGVATMLIFNGGITRKPLLEQKEVGYI
jgi:hypothetical protein